MNEPDFLEIVTQAWNFEATGSHLWKFHMKLKNTCKQLSWWSKNHIGNIFDKNKELESVVADIENKFIRDNSEVNRMNLNKANAQLIMHTKREKTYWRQKTGMKWFKEGDSNTKFFHSEMNDKKRRMTLRRMKKEDNTWIEGNVNIASEAINFFSK